LVSTDFVRAYKELPEAKKIGKAARTLEDQGLKTEYPFFGRSDLPIWIPSKAYTQEDAQEALTNAEYIFQDMSKILEEDYGIKVE
jgi:HEPN domain-containing protein